MFHEPTQKFLRVPIPEPELFRYIRNIPKCI